MSRNLTNVLHTHIILCTFCSIIFQKERNLLIFFYRFFVKGASPPPKLQFADLHTITSTIGGKGQLKAKALPQGDYEWEAMLGWVCVWFFSVTLYQLYFEERCFYLFIQLLKNKM
jgi:hypothetical protein